SRAQRRQIFSRRHPHARVSRASNLTADLDGVTINPDGVT
ncbi:hypothetical protein Tco_0476996, partial [Tanacetum coccineum]